MNRKKMIEDFESTLDFLQDRVFGEFEFARNELKKLKQREETIGLLRNSKKECSVKLGVEKGE